MKQLEKHIHVQNNKICNKRIQVTPSSLLSLFNTQENENGMFFKIKTYTHIKYVIKGHCHR